MRWGGNGTDKCVPWTSLGLSMGMSFLWESHGKRPMGWDGAGINCYGMGMGQRNMSHGQPCYAPLLEKILSTPLHVTRAAQRSLNGKWMEQGRFWLCLISVSNKSSARFNFNNKWYLRINIACRKCTRGVNAVAPPSALSSRVSWHPSLRIHLVFQRPFSESSWTAY